jgi:hypothetical protein
MSQPWYDGNAALQLLDGECELTALELALIE